MYKKLLKLKVWQKILIFIIFGLVVFVGLLLHSVVDNNSRSEVVSTDLTAEEEQKIINFLLDQSALSWKTVQNSRNFCVFENLDTTGTKFPISLWVRCGEFTAENGKINEHSGISVAVLLGYSLKNKEYTIQMPGDGSQSGSDIRKIFPNKVQKTIFSYDATLISSRLQILAEKELLNH